MPPLSGCAFISESIQVPFSLLLEFGGSHLTGSLDLRLSLTWATLYLIVRVFGDGGGDSSMW